MTTSSPIHSTKHQPAAFGIFPSRIKAELAIRQLREAGFDKHEISLVLPHPEHPHPHVPESKAVEGAEIGAGAGAVAGGVLGWLAAAGMLTIPGLTTLLVLGPIATFLIPIGALAGVGGLWGGLVGIGIPEKEAKNFHTRLGNGDYLLSVHVDGAGRLPKAKEIMVENGAEDVYSRLETHR